MALHYAVRNKLLNEIRDLVEGGVDVNGQDRNCRTPLMICCFGDDQKFEVGVARMLLQSGAKVGKADKDGRNSLMLASIFGRDELMELFLKAVDFDCNKKDKFGNTALHYASLGGKLTILTNLLHKLLRFKANINTRNHFGQTAASLAKKARMDDCVKVFETETTEADFGSKAPNKLLTKPWSKDIKHVENPILMLEQAEKEVSAGINIYKSRSDFNIHQFRRGRRLPDDLTLNKKNKNIKRKTSMSNSGQRLLNRKKISLLEKKRHLIMGRKNCSCLQSTSAMNHSWKKIVPHFMNVLRVQVSPSYRPAATPVAQNYDDIFKKADIVQPNTGVESNDCFEKPTHVGQERRKSVATLRTKIKPEFDDAYTNQVFDAKRKGRRFSETIPMVHRTKTASKLL